MLKFSGKRPTDLGVKDGKFTAARTWKPNWVSSQVAADDPHYVAAYRWQGDGRAAMQRLLALVGAMPRAKVVQQKDSYLHAEFSTPLMGYTDDVEFYADAKGVQVRSSSRLGVRDFNVNRKRVESIRKAFEQQA